MTEKVSKDIKVAEDGLEPTKSFTAGEVAHLDESEAFLQENNITEEYLAELVNDKEKNRRLVRKIDLMILPLLAGTYVLQYIDKQALSYAAVFDLFSSTSVTQTEYSWFASIFYLAYLVAEYPWVYIAQKTRMGKVVAGCVLSWGSVLMITAACSNFPGLAACRFLLGVFEAPITTCFMMMVSMWYVRSEQPMRAGLFYCCNGVGSMLGGVLSYGIGQIDSFPVWKAVFLICGGITVVWGGLLLVFLPDSILSAKRFSLEERALLVGRARLAKTGVLNKTIKWYQVKEACLDPQVWLLTLFVLLNEVINGGVANFGKLIIKGLVTDPLLTTALGIPQGAFQVFWILTGAYTASKFRNQRTTVMAVWLIPTIIGCCMIWKLDRTHYKVGVLFGYYMIGCYVASLVLALQMPATNLGGYTKRITASAIVFTAYCVGNIIGPHAFLAKEAPLYATGCKLILACSASQVAIAVGLRMLLIRRNKQRDAAAAAAGISPDAEHDDEGVDLTDKENPNFRYVL
ncbi:major facilitator superfamily transporter [Colletotrichum paranaense]|uniref:Major facilitator superfamily transporter n=2 Tax=Colletotrichum acutatum species complex TaxID=2707335 RepID=A0AAI9UCK9_9PEZI|nr:major facilitator superfamily transporter [Colletotrichum paranaense]KAK1454787.1 major facilitator superfamily transporter [Colletotrichum melonis]KAK1547749.1 major facilitator superfamily transporter [Colletotrichum paranaense]